ncbi:organic cation transporter protein [Magallana gigas]|uniref:organic cation transporter protein n=1 Tax=Magallana gigas TaxID=29159 RepID=UPI00333FECDB
MNFDEILEKLGEFGRYQKIVYFLAVCLPSVSGGAFMVISVFLLGVPDHRCALPALENDTYEIQNEAHRSLVEIYIPNTDPDDETLLYDRCNYFVYTNDTVTNFTKDSKQKTKCSEWVYSDDIHGKTFATKMNIVCEDRFRISLAKSMFFVGVLFGAFGFGNLSDAIGRKKTLCSAAILMMVSSIGLSWASSYVAYVLIRFCMGASYGGTSCGFIIGMEMVGPRKRVYAGIVTNYFFAFGFILLGGIAYVLKDWFWIELCLSIPTVFYLSYWWIIPESPRWLLRRGRQEEAEMILRRAAEVNKVLLPEKLFDEETQYTPSTVRIWSLFSSKALLTRTLILFFNWMVVSITYYGLSLNTGNLAGDFYLNFFLTAVMDFPAYTMCLMLMDRWGRKKCHCSAMILGGIACLSTILTTTFGGKDLQWLTTTLAMIGKLGSAAAFAVIYVFSAELYPTVVRNAGMGASSCCARIGGILAPYVADSGVLIGGQFGKAVPLVIIGAASVVAGLMSLKLPETLNTRMPDTIADGIAFGTTEYNKMADVTLSVEPPSKENITSKL